MKPLLTQNTERGEWERVQEEENLEVLCVTDDESSRCVHMCATNYSRRIVNCNQHASGNEP